MYSSSWSSLVGETIEDGEWATLSQLAGSFSRPQADASLRIRKDKINGHSIRLPGISAMQMPALPSMSIMGLGSSSTERDRAAEDKAKEDSSGEEQWTKACRGVLAVLKRILIVESEGDRREVASTAPSRDA